MVTVTRATTAQGTTPTSEVLTLAADTIRDSGWATVGGWVGDYEQRRTGAVCIEGGLMAALGLSFPSEDDNGNPVLAELKECPAYKAVHDYLVEKGRMEYGSWLWYFNDSVARNKADVIRVLRTVARREKKKELASE